MIRKSMKPGSNLVKNLAEPEKLHSDATEKIKDVIFIKEQLFNEVREYLAW